MAKNLYVGNLSPEVTQDDLTVNFKEVGDVVSAVVIKDKFSGESKGFGFVEVADDQMEAAIVAMNGKEFNGRTLTVNEARPRTERPRGNYDRGPRNNSYGSSY